MDGKRWKVLFTFLLSATVGSNPLTHTAPPEPPSATPLLRLSNSIDRQNAFASVKRVYLVCNSTGPERHPVPLAPFPFPSYELQISTGDQNMALNLPNTHSASNIGMGRAGGGRGRRERDCIDTGNIRLLTPFSMTARNSGLVLMFLRSNSKHFLMGESRSRCVWIRSLLRREAWEPKIITCED